MSPVTEDNHVGNDNTSLLNRGADYSAGVAGGSFPIGGSISKQRETPTEAGCFCCCRKANRGAHDVVDFCEYRVIEPVGICCCTVVGGVVIGVCLVCAGACKCVACTASYINEKALKPVERGVGGGIVCVGEALSHLGEPNEETKAAWKAAELEKDAKPEEQGYCSWFWGGVVNCLCCAKANDHQEKPLHWDRYRGNLDNSQQPTTRQDCCLLRCCPCMGREPDHQEGALTDPHTKSGGKRCCPCAGREPDHQERSLGLGGDSRQASLPTEFVSSRVFNPTPLPGLQASAGGSFNGGRLFDTIDRNHDGVITRDELEQAFSGDGQVDSAVSNIFAKKD